MLHTKYLKLGLLCLFSSMLFACGTPTDSDITMDLIQDEQEAVMSDTSDVGAVGTLRVEHFGMVGNQDELMQEVESFLEVNKISREQIINLEFSITAETARAQVLRELVLVWEVK